MCEDGEDITQKIRDKYDEGRYKVNKKVEVKISRVEEGKIFKIPLG